MVLRGETLLARGQAFLAGMIPDLLRGVMGR